MGLGKNMQTIRENRGLSQEQLAFHFNVPTETIKAWEEETLSPALNVLMELALFLEVTVDELVCGEYIPSTQEDILIHKKENKKPKKQAKQRKETSAIKEKRHFEYRSKYTIFQYPLVHINLGMKMYEAKGVIAIGNIARGMICIGLYGFGVLSLGLLSIGLLSIGLVSLGGISLGCVAVGYISIGGIAIGMYACGYLALACKIAIGYDARGYVAIGNKVQATFGLISNEQISTTMIFEYALRQGMPDWIARLLLLFI